MINRIVSVIAGLMLGAATNSAASDSYNIPVYDGQDVPIAWSFQNRVLSNAFPNPAPGTQLYFWDTAHTNFLTTLFFDDVDGWNYPNFVITNGVGFYWRHYGDDTTVTVSGDILTVTNVSQTYLSGKAYFLGMKFPQDESNDGVNACECVSNTNGFHYTLYSLNLVSNDGDAFYLNHWNGPFDFGWGGPITHVPSPGGVIPYWTNYATQLSPQLQKGRGFWFYPGTNGNVTWNQLKLKNSCLD